MPLTVLLFCLKHYLVSSQAPSFARLNFHDVHFLIHTFNRYSLGFKKKGKFRIYEYSTVVAKVQEQTENAAVVAQWSQKPFHMSLLFNIEMYIKKITFVTVISKHGKFGLI